MSDLKIIFDAIKAKQSSYNALEGYYHGNQPTVYLTKRMREIFRPLDISFVENWCAVVIDACDERINLDGWETTDETVDEVLTQAWERNQLGNESSDVHTDAQIFGESFIIAWPGEDGFAEVFYNDARIVHVIKSATNPRKIYCAGKLWADDQGLARMTLYYADRLEYYRSDKKLADISTSETFVLDTDISATGTLANPYNRVPVFQFKMNTAGMSDLVNVLPLQNGINKLLSDMMVAAEYGAYNQRWIISQGDTSALKNEPGAVWDLPAGDGVGQDTAVGQFQSTDLKNYLDAIDRLAMAIGIISRTPKHYFFGQGGAPSGEALIALEAPLNKKAQDRIDRFAPIWKDLAMFICQIENVAVDPKDLKAEFKRPETVQPRTEAEIIKLNVDAGIPLEIALEKAGWEDSEIEKVTEYKDAEAQKSKDNLANALLTAQNSQKTQPMPGETPMKDNQTYNA